MKLLASALLIGVAAASPPLQQPLQEAQQAQPIIRPSIVDNLATAAHDLQRHLSSLTEDARAVWDEVAALFPDAMTAQHLFSAPKKHIRRPDSHWDHVLRGEDVQDVWVENAKGEKERKVGGRLEAYNLRSKKVDPSALGVDPGVKQYSGYLDDQEEDKHLFYCESEWQYDVWIMLMEKGSSNRATIPRMIPSCFG